MVAELPEGVTVFERGWLSSNNILLFDGRQAVMVDTGYATHAEQTLFLVQAALRGRPLDLIWNTHLHSDHCGGNARLQAAYPSVRTFIPPGMSDAVKHWDDGRLTYELTGQLCPRFRMDGVLEPGTSLDAARLEWAVWGAPGHDPHSIMLFNPQQRILISADALWEDGFGVVFPELEGGSGFDEVGETLDVIESLDPRTVIPGHGRPFSEVTQALARARTRLQGLRADPIRHAWHAAKVMLKFKLLEIQQVPKEQFIQWALEMPLVQTIHREHAAGPIDAWVSSLLDALERSGAIDHQDGQLSNR